MNPELKPQYQKKKKKKRKRMSNVCRERERSQPHMLYQKRVVRAEM
jgi:hypothetical protein